VRVRLNGDGAVSTVPSLPPLLVKAAKENMKMWSFSRPVVHLRSGNSEFDFIYVFELRGVAPSDHPCSLMRYEYPNRVTITSKAPPWIP
jgi:hypothetical protein